MFTGPSRRLAVGIAATALLLGAAPASASAAPAPCAGVWVVVQSDQADAGTAQATCATEYATGLDALKSAGHTTEFAKNMLGRIDGLPSDTDFTSNGGFYWSYWNATVNADGTLGQWTYYQVGPDASKPVSGTAEGWLLTNEQQASGPALTRLPDSPASASPTAASSPSAGSPSGGSPIGVIVAGVIVVVGLIGIAAWWLTRGRRRRS